MPDYTPVVLDTPIVVPKPAMTLAGIRRHHRFDGFEFARLIGETMDALDAPAGVDGFDYLVGVEVAGGEGRLTGFTTLALPAQAYLVVTNREGDDPLDIWVPVVTSRS